MALNSLQAKA